MCKKKSKKCENFFSFVYHFDQKACTVQLFFVTLQTISATKIIMIRHMPRDYMMLKETDEACSHLYHSANRPVKIMNLVRHSPATTFR